MSARCNWSASGTSVSSWRSPVSPVEGRIHD